jgi:hypothetical protein
MQSATKHLPGLFIKRRIKRTGMRAESSSDPAKPPGFVIARFATADEIPPRFPKKSPLQDFSA